MLRSVLATLAVVLAACSSGGSKTQREEAPMTMSITSPAFADGSEIPREYTCDGADVSPPLQISDVPSGAVELALLVTDPDAPGGTFVHWVAWGISPAHPALGKGEAAPHSGRSGFGRTGYGGPCPPRGKPHRYVFTVYALSAHLDLADRASADDLRRAIDGKVLAEGRLTGRYARG